MTGRRVLARALRHAADRLDPRLDRGGWLVTGTAPKGEPVMSEEEWRQASALTLCARGGEDGDDDH